MNIRSILTRADILLIVFFLAIACALLAGLNRQPGSKAEIKYGDRIVGVYSLNEDRVIEIDEGIVAEIKDGQIHMLRSTCPHHICVEQGWTSSQAKPIVCVPNKVFIRIIGDKPEMMITE